MLVHVERPHPGILRPSCRRAIWAKGASFACSKAAILSLTKTVALEWAKRGIFLSLGRVSNDYQWYRSDGRWSFQRVKSSRRRRLRRPDPHPAQ